MFSKIKESLSASLQHLVKNQPFLTVDRMKSSRQSDEVTWDSDRFLITKRKIGFAILLYVFTLGLYGICWKYRLIKNIRSLKKDNSDPTVELLCLLFVPFYSYYWWFSRSACLQKAFAQHGYRAHSKILYLIFSILQLDLISISLMQKDFNSLPSEPVEIPPQRVTMFTVSCTPTSLIAGLILFFVSLLFVIVDIGAFSSANFEEKWLVFAVALLLPFLIFFFTIFRFESPNPKAKKVLPFLLLFFMPLLSISMTECLNNVFIYNMTYLGFFANYMLILNLFFLVFAISGSFRITYLVINPILYGFALAHSYIVDFRGTPFLPMDFLSIGTAMGVANTYNYAPTYKTVVATLLFVWILVVAVKSKTPKYNLKVRISSRLTTGILSFILFFTFMFTNVFVDFGVKPDFWNQTRGYQNYGFAFNFFSNTKYLFVAKPSNYDSTHVGTIVDDVVEQSGEPYQIDPSKTRPNIICIMNESLADLGVLGELETNEDYMPFMRSLTENTIRGNLYVPVIGAGTSNTEFEFLTGHTTSFLPPGSNAYMLYIKNNLASLVSTLRSQGYSSYAFHPYYAAGWHRTDVYSYMGFDRFTSLEDIIDINLMKDFQAKGSDPNYLQQLIEQYYPGENMLIRQYISDSYDYKLLINDFEKRDKDTPYFAFNVTMQNHGGYTTSCVNFDENIYPTSVEGDYIKAKSYLSLVQKSDTAFKELIDYFKTVKEPTVICMFGDHQPSVETQFIAEVMGVSNLTWLSMDQEQKRHITPFFIWANYDIEEDQIDMLSSNYLSSLLLKTAGVELTKYNQYLLELSKQLPVIDTVGYIDSEGNYYKWSDVTEYTDTLSGYERIQYNGIFDSEHEDKDIFYLNGVAPEFPASSNAESTASEGTK